MRFHSRHTDSKLPWFPPLVPFVVFWGLFVGVGVAAQHFGNTPQQVPQAVSAPMTLAELKKAQQDPYCVGLLIEAVSMVAGRDMGLGHLENLHAAQAAAKELGESFLSLRDRRSVLRFIYGDGRNLDATTISKRIERGCPEILRDLAQLK